MKKLLIGFAVLMLVAGVAWGEGEIYKIHYQGRVVDSAGNPPASLTNDDIMYTLKDGSTITTNGHCSPSVSDFSYDPKTGIFDLLIAKDDTGGPVSSSKVYKQVGISVRLGGSWQNFGNKDLSYVPLALSAANVAAGGLKLPFVGAGSSSTKPAFFAMNNYNPTAYPIFTTAEVFTLPAFSNAYKFGVGSMTAALGVGSWGISMNPLGGIGVLGQSMAQMGLGAKPFQSIGVYGGSDGVGVMGGGTVAWSGTSILTTETAMCGVLGAGAWFGVMGRSNGGNGVYGYSRTGTGIVAETDGADNYAFKSYGPKNYIQGAVGIGTTPDEMRGKVKIVSGTTQPGLYFNGSNRDITWDTGDDLEFGTMPDTGDYLEYGEKMRITSGGSVGIGTTGPNTKLEVASGSGGRMSATDGQGSNRRSLLLVSPTSTDDYARIESYKYGTTGVGMPLAINDVGKGFVGIGTNNPDSTLHVVAENSSKDPMRVMARTSTGGTATALRVDKNQGVAIGNDETPPAEGLPVHGGARLGDSSSAPAIKTWTFYDATLPSAGSGSVGCPTANHVYLIQMLNRTDSGKWYNSSNCTIYYYNSKIYFEDTSPDWILNNPYRIFMIYD